jgi:hypothetical protein
MNWKMNLINYLRNEIVIPIVVVSMTITEAEYLRDKVGSSYQEHEDLQLTAFKQLTESLQAYNVLDFTEYYGQRRDDWKTYSCSNELSESIETLVNEMIDEFNEYSTTLQNMNLPIIQPSFVSTEFFELNDDRRAAIWSELGRRGCLIIVDSVSLFHPRIRKYLAGAQVVANEKTSILVLSPINPQITNVNQILENLIKSEIELAFHRFNTEFDKRCEIGLGDLRSMKRWLFSILPETIEILKPPQPYLENRRKMRSTGDINGVDALWTRRQ